MVPSLDSCVATASPSSRNTERGAAMPPARLCIAHSIAHRGRVRTRGASRCWEKALTKHPEVFVTTTHPRTRGSRGSGAAESRSSVLTDTMDSRTD